MATLASIGFGLAISRRIVEAHGGRIWLASNDASGACFRLRLPTNGGSCDG